jgi:hypothetical protein
MQAIEHALNVDEVTHAVTEPVPFHRRRPQLPFPFFAHFRVN